MSSPDDILNSESNRCSPSDTQKKDESATQDTLKEALEDVLKHPYFSEFYKESDVEKSSKKIKVPVKDNTKLTLK